jgi:hypothetical protein
MYPADRARFCVDFDKLSRRVGKTPLTSLLAGIKSATRPIDRSTSLDKARANGGHTRRVAVTKQSGRGRNANRASNLGLGSAEPRRTAARLTGQPFL